VALVRTDVSEERSASSIRVTRIGELGTLAVTTSSSEPSVLTRATRRNIPEDGILHSHRHENLKSYIDSNGQYLIVGYCKHCKETLVPQRATIS
jgi:hypothetical protein